MTHSNRTKLRKRTKLVMGGIVLGCSVLLLGLAIRKGEGQLSSAVALVSKGPIIDAFLQNPTLGYVQAYMRFGDDMADDVIMGIDQEFIEGVKNPLYVSGGDWMALVGVQRSGIVWVGGGSEDTEKGHPSKNRNWKILNLDTRLQPNTWYRMRTLANFSTRRFKTFTIEGPGLSKTIDISECRLDYPNMIPFSDRAMSYYTFAMRGRSMMKRVGTPLAYFDDVEGGFLDHAGNPHKVFENGFENQDSVEKQPVTLPVIHLEGYKSNWWYLEREEAVFHIEKSKFARTGSKVGVADASLK